MTNRLAGLIFDLDGTVLRGNSVLPGVPETLAQLRQRGLRLAFFTNDNANTPYFLAERLAGMGIEAEPYEILTAALIAAEVTAELYPQYKILAAGHAGLIEALKAKNLEVVDYEEAGRAEVVVMGRDPYFDYQRLTAVCQAIWRGAEFIATNYDPKIPTATGFVPGTGAWVKAVAYATGREPIVTGKPSLWSGRVALRILNLAPDQVVVVGDQLDTDIAMGKNVGIFSILVLTGVTSREEAQAAFDDLKPDLILPDVNHLVGWLDETYR
jgi:4-nitrophenyl phosphatase